RVGGALLYLPADADRAARLGIPQADLSAEGRARRAVVRLRRDRANRWHRHLAYQHPRRATRRPLDHPWTEGVDDERAARAADPAAGAHLTSARRGAPRRLDAVLRATRSQH